MTFYSLREIFSFKTAQVVMLVALVFSACVPPYPVEEELAAPEPVSEEQCLRLLSSAAEYYKNKDWNSTSRVYGELVDLGCDKGSEEEIFQYWAIAYE
ncbi:MAG TPA: hypothetical protein EYO92_07520, partial [Candidatus Marinimicrobia bacterium]|nr:hypothetical protein [Candidatus Neomarinimicrobiota bacterium]